MSSSQFGQPLSSDNIQPTSMNKIMDTGTMTSMEETTIIISNTPTLTRENLESGM